MKIKKPLFDVFGMPYERPKKKRNTTPNKSKKNIQNTINNIIIIENGTKLGLSKKHLKILKNCKEESTTKELMSIIGVSNVSKFRNEYLNKLIDKKFIEYVNPKFIYKKIKIVKRDESGTVLRDEDGKMIYVDKLDQDGNPEFKKCIAPNPQQKYKRTGKFVRNKLA